MILDISGSTFPESEPLKGSRRLEVNYKLAFHHKMSTDMTSFQSSGNKLAHIGQMELHISKYLSYCRPAGERRTCIFTLEKK